ncbi:MAG: hypothetical protein QME64_02365 [bacterium]|nr:hypothetical protein [bacterium]
MNVVNFAEELYTHLEDKALAYLNDNERLSEEDILLLVREHFGNPENLGQFRGELSNLNGQLLLGDNRYFNLAGANYDKRLGFGVSHPEKWKKILPIK